MRYVIRLLATGFGAGLSPKAPGTVGSLVGLGAAYLCHQATLLLNNNVTAYENPLEFVLFGTVPALLIVLISYLVISLEETWSHQHDSQTTVIDEIAGQSIALLWFTPSIGYYVLGFALFRLFDIWKPSIIGRVDRDLGGAWGTLLDDIFAGAITALILGITSYLTTTYLS